MATKAKQPRPRIASKAAPKKMTRRELVESMCGKYRDVLGSVDDFMARKHAEVDEELRRESERGR